MTAEPWIETYTGVEFPLIDVDPDKINIADISHALAQECRFAGHCSRFYSVAEHCVHVYYEAIRREIRDEETLKAIILHDASEAYLKDLPRPLKMVLPEYRQIEGRLQAAIYEKFGVNYTCEIDSQIKEVDYAVLKRESQILMASRGENWLWGDTVAAASSIECWNNWKAEAHFREIASSHLEDAE